MISYRKIHYGCQEIFFYFKNIFKNQEKEGEKKEKEKRLKNSLRAMKE